MNPLLPDGWDIALGLLTLASLALTIVALISLLRARNVGRLAAAIWALVIIFAPVLGPTTWLIADARARARGATASH